MGRAVGGIELRAFGRRRTDDKKEILMVFTGVPEPALSEPAQQLIGVRSGGERGHYCTTTPRLEEIQFGNRRWLTARRSLTGEKRLDDT